MAERYTVIIRDYQNSRLMWCSHSHRERRVAEECSRKWRKRYPYIVIEIATIKLAERVR